MCMSLKDTCSNFCSNNGIVVLSIVAEFLPKNIDSSGKMSVYKITVFKIFGLWLMVDAWRHFLPSSFLVIIHFRCEDIDKK